MFWGFYYSGFYNENFHYRNKSDNKNGFKKSIYLVIKSNTREHQASILNQMLPFIHMTSQKNDDETVTVATNTIT